MRTRSWFKFEIATPTSRGMARLARKFGAHEAMSIWVRLLCLLHEEENYIDWADPDVRMDVCMYLYAEETTLYDFFDEVAKLEWVDAGLWDSKRVIASIDVQANLDAYSKAKERAIAGAEKRWKKEVDDDTNATKEHADC